MGSPAAASDYSPGRQTVEVLLARPPTQSHDVSIGDLRWHLPGCTAAQFQSITHWRCWLCAIDHSRGRNFVHANPLAQCAWFGATEPHDALSFSCCSSICSVGEESRD